MQDLHRAPKIKTSIADVAVRVVASPRVYLAGPIKGLQYDDAVTWRERAAEELAPEITAFSPMRGKEYLNDGTALGDFYSPRDILAAPKAIFGRDHNDVKSADMVIAFLLGASAVSIGTCVEIGWTNAYRVPLVVVEREGGAHWHPFVTEAANWIVGSVEEAVFVARSVLLP